MKTYISIILTLILVTLMTATYFLYRNLQKSNTQVTVRPTPTVQEKPEQPQSSMAKQPSAQILSSVTGKICYPSEAIPPMDIYLKNIETETYHKIQSSMNQQSYEFDSVMPGKYVVFAYLQSGAEYGGGYTNAVPCGLMANCTNHKLIEFTVVEGADFKNADVCDWYGAELPEKP